MHRVGRERSGVTRGAGIGQQANGDIALRQGRGQCLGWKQMAACSAGGDENAAGSHQAGLPA
jgi:hypothetical protein